MPMNINIPNDCKVAHLLFSGGIDSTLLLYLLAKEQFTHERFVVKCYSMNMRKHTSIHDKCKNIITSVENIFLMKIPYYTKPTKYYIRNFVSEILLAEDGCVYTGCNKVLDFLQPTNYIPEDTPPVRGPRLNEKHMRPFINMDKSVIIKAYEDLQIRFLLEKTYSCGFNLKVACGACYFCLEKNWGMINSMNNV